MKNMKVAMEISSSGIKLVAGYVYNDDKVYILDAIETSANLLQNGHIIDTQASINCLKEIVNLASEALKCKISNVIICIPPLDLKVVSKQITTTTVSSDNILDTVDITNVLNALVKSASNDIPTNYKCANLLSKSFITDNGTIYKKLDIDSKIAASSITLNGDVYFLPSSTIDEYISVFAKAGLKVTSTIVSSSAVFCYLNSFKDIPNNFIYIDYGYGLTTISKGDRNSLQASSIIYRGSKDLDKAIANNLNCSLKDAIKYKEVYGLSNNPNFEFLFDSTHNLEQLKNIIVKELDKLTNDIKNEMARFQNCQSSTIILSGGGSNLLNFKQYLKEKLGQPVIDFSLNTFGARNKTFVNSIAMLYYNNQQVKFSDDDRLANFSFRRVN